MTTKTPSRFGPVLVATMILTTVAASQDPEPPRITGTTIRVIDESLEVRNGDPVRIEESRVLVFDGAPGLPTIIPTEELVAIVTGPVTSRSTYLSDRKSAARAGDDAPIAVPYLELVDGQRFPGTLRPGTDGDPVWRSAWVKDLRFDLDRISKLKLSEDDQVVPTAVDADVVVLSNGDRIEGLVMEIGMNVEIEVDRPDGDTGSVTIPIDRVASISLVNPMEPASGSMTWLRGGHRIRSESVRIVGDGYISLMSPLVGGDTAEIPLDFLVATVVDADRVIPLASRKVVSLEPGPAGEIRPWIPEPTPLPGHHAFDAPPIRMDGPLRVRFDLPSRGGRLAMTLERPMEIGAGRLVFRILDDGRVVHSVIVDEDEPVHRIVVDFESDRLGMEIDPSDDGPFHDSIVLREAIIVRPPE
ncbi:MAG: hypothetical protein CMJ34_09710 [Phycisphaerae bacterium]|nr:hypothetical protein [Phycisphaerae bacterium]